MDELKPCPFCGGEARLTIGQEIVTKKGMVPTHYVAWCSKHNSAQIVRNTAEETAEVWNTRPIEDSLRRQLAEEIEVKRKLRQIITGLEERIAALEAEWRPVDNDMPMGKIQAIVELYVGEYGFDVDKLLKWRSLPPGGTLPQDAAE